MSHQSGGAQVPGKRKRDPKGTRERLVRAALELFTTEGYHSSTTPLIASKAGIAEGTIYRHFESKGQMLNEIYRAAVRLLAAPVGEPAGSRSCSGRLHHIATAWQEIAAANPSLIRLIFSADLTGQLDSSSAAALDGLMHDLEAVVADGKSAGEVRAGSARIWADVWLKLAVLVLERVASGEWAPNDAGPTQVLDSAWAAIRTPSP